MPTIALDGDRLERLPSSSLAWTAKALYGYVTAAARAELGTDGVAAVLLHAGATLPRAECSLTSFGIDESTVLRCAIVASARALRCEPSIGPATGGTLVRVHGEGFTEASGFGSSVRMSFGPGLTVPCWRESDHVLCCRTPAHAPGPVDIRLVSCVSAEDDEMGAAFEYIRPEAVYDAIFASTNSNCPVVYAPSNQEGSLPSASSTPWSPGNLGGPRMQF